MEHTEREEKDITKDLNTKKDFVQTVEKTCYAYKEKLEKIITTKLIHRCRKEKGHDT